MRRTIVGCVRWRVIVPLNTWSMGAMLLGVALASSAWSATVSGKQSAAASAAGIALPAAAAPVVSTTIAQGKKKHLLLVQATIQELGINPPGDTMTMYPTVNGIGFEPDMSTPSNDQVWKGCMDPFAGPGGSGDYPVCSFTGTWWIDLDTAEAANVGMIIGKPLMVSLNARGFFGNVTDVNVSMSVRLVAK